MHIHTPGQHTPDNGFSSISSGLVALVNRHQTPRVSLALSPFLPNFLLFFFLCGASANRQLCLRPDPKHGGPFSQQIAAFHFPLKSLI